MPLQAMDDLREELAELQTKETDETRRAVSEARASQMNFSMDSLDAEACTTFTVRLSNTARL